MTRGEGFLEAIGVETRVVQHVDEQGPEERIELVRDADDGDAAWLENAGKFRCRPFVFRGVLDRPHRVDRVEGAGAEGQCTDVRRDATALVSRQDTAREAHRVERDVDTKWTGSLLRRPPEELGVL